MVMLGGGALKSNTELHDVVFVCGHDINETYPQLKDLWFGDQKGLHIDCWMRVDQVDGFDVVLFKKPCVEEKKLYFINMGAYQSGVFNEFHENRLLIANSIEQAKHLAKQQSMLTKMESLHKDYIHECQRLIELKQLNGWFIHLTKSTFHVENKVYAKYTPIV